MFVITDKIVEVYDLITRVKLIVNDVHKGVTMDGLFIEASNSLYSFSDSTQNNLILWDLINDKKNIIDTNNKLIIGIIYNESTEELITFCKDGSILGF